MFLDASAIVAILTLEEGWEQLEEKAANASERSTSAVATFEAILGISRKKGFGLAEARIAVEEFLLAMNVSSVGIDAAIGNEAVSAHSRFGKGRHRAALNMGDCFAYACARSRNVPLLFKGDDFGHTDIAVA